MQIVQVAFKDSEKKVGFARLMLRGENWSGKTQTTSAECDDESVRMLTSKKEGSSDAEAGKIAAKPTGLSKQELVSFLRDAKLRPTRQRISLAKILYSKGDRHVTAELLHDEVQKAGMPVSLATVYNALRQFSEAGLLRAIAVDSSRTFFDTNTGDHHHFFIEESGEVVDVPHDGIVIDNIPNAPRDLQISGVDVIIRLRPVG